MGEYFKLANVTRREYIHPHRVDCGLKLPEWNYPDSPVWRRVAALKAAARWTDGDELRAVSDYGSVYRLTGAPKTDTYDAHGNYDNTDLVSLPQGAAEDSPGSYDDISHNWLDVSDR